MKEVLNNLQNSTDETREQVIKQLLKKMGQAELEEWIRNSDLPDEFKQQMLGDIKGFLGTIRILIFLLLFFVNNTLFSFTLLITF